MTATLDGLVTTTPPGAFVAVAERFLASFDVGRALELACQVPGAWHPTGFMVFHTTEQFNGNPVRVHCWPRGRRPIESGHPQMHDHAWPLVAKVVHGVYSETVYDLSASVDGPLTRYAVTYHGRDDATVGDNGERCRIRCMSSATYGVGDCHFLPAGAYHQTTIPEDECVVTVMVRGRPEKAAPDLLGPPGFPTARRRRRLVQDREFMTSLAGLLDRPV